MFLCCKKYSSRWVDGKAILRATDRCHKMDLQCWNNTIKIATKVNKNSDGWFEQ